MIKIEEGDWKLLRRLVGIGGLLTEGLDIWLKTYFIYLFIWSKEKSTLQKPNLSS